MDDAPDHSHEHPSATAGEELPPPRLCSYQVKFDGGIESQEQAQRIADAVHRFAYSYSRYLPLEKIDGITFAEDYQKALNDLDRGFETKNPLIATSESFAAGVAMSPTVLRDGVIKTHIVFYAGIGRMIASDEIDSCQMAAHVIIHEFGHASYNQILDEALPGVMLRPVEDRYEGYLYPYSCSCFDEYIATRNSSFVGKGALPGYQETLVSVCLQANERLVSARKVYFNDEDFIKLADATLSAIGSVMKFSGYVLGHADGENEPAFDADGKLEAALERLSLVDWFKDLQDRLRDTYDNLSNIQSFDEILALNRSLEEAARIHGVHPKKSESGEAWVDIETRVYWMDS